MKRQTTCIVTGGAGFIGSQLCSYLLKKNNKVICIDNFLTGSEKNISELRNNSDFSFLNHDIIHPIKDKNITSVLPIDFIFHLASPASPIWYKKYSIQTLMVNSVGTKNMLDLSLIKKSVFILASTSEVYGNPEVHPQKETYYGHVNSVGNRACYDEAKRFSEAITMEYIKKFNLNAVIIRIFNTYGPKMQVLDGRVVSNFIIQALNKEPLTIYGDGKQTRSLCFVDDLIEGLYKAAIEKKAYKEVINLGNPDEKTVIDIAKLILELTESKEIGYKYLSKDYDDPDRRKPDISKAKNILNWKPKTDLRSGLLKTIEYFQKL